MAVNAADLASPYSAIFEKYIFKNLSMTMRNIKGLSETLPEDDCKQAFHILNYAFKIPRAWSKARELLLTLAPKITQTEFRDAWLPYLEHGVDQSENLQDTLAQAEFQFYLGMLYDQQGKYTQATTVLQASVENFQVLENDFGQAKALNRLAHLARNQRAYKQANQHLKIALRLLPPDNGERAYSYLILGNLAIDAEDWAEANDYLKQSFELAQCDDDQRTMAWSLINQGVVGLYTENYENSRDLFDEANTLFEAMNDRFYQGVAQISLGHSCLALEKPKQALIHYYRAERTFRALRNQLRLAQVNHGLGRTYRKLKQWKKAEESYLLNLAEWERLGNTERYLNSMDGLGLVYMAQKDFERAITTFETGLQTLTQIESQPGYKALLTMFTTHLEEARQQANHYQNTMSESTR